MGASYVKENWRGESQGKEISEEVRHGPTHDKTSREESHPGERAYHKSAAPRRVGNCALSMTSGKKSGERGGKRSHYAMRRQLFRSGGRSYIGRSEKKFGIRGGGEWTRGNERRRTQRGKRGPGVLYSWGVRQGEIIEPDAGPGMGAGRNGDRMQNRGVSSHRKK